MNIKVILFQVLIALLALLKGVISLKLLTGISSDTYAYVSQFMVLSLFLGQVLLMNYGFFVVVSISKGQSKRLIYYSTTFLLILTSAIFSFISVKYYSFFNEFFFDGKNGELYYLFFIYTIIYSFSLKNLSFFQAHKDFYKYGCYQILQMLGFILSIISCMVFEDIKYFIYTLILVEVVLVVFSDFNIRRAYLSDDNGFVIERVCESAFSWLLNNLYKSMSLFFVTFLIWLYFNFGRILVVNVSGIEKLAVYSGSLSMILIGGMFVNNIANIIFPHLSSEITSDKVQKSMYLMLVFTLFPSIVIYFTSPILLSFFASKEYYLGAGFFNLYLMSIIILGQIRILSIILIIRNEENHSWTAYTLGMIVFAIISWFFYDDSLISIPCGLLVGALIAYTYMMKKVKYKANWLMCIITLNSSFMAVFDTYHFDFSFINSFIFSLIFLMGNMIVLFLLRDFRTLIKTIWFNKINNIV